MPLEFRFALNSQKLTLNEPLTYCQASVRPLCSTAAGACTLHPCEVIAVSLLLKEAWGISMEQLRKPRVRTAFKSIAKKGPSWASLCGGLADWMPNSVRRHPKSQGLTLSTHTQGFTHSTSPSHSGVSPKRLGFWVLGLFLCVVFLQEARDCYMVGRAIAMAK